MFELKPISHDAVQEALAKAERYRLLNDPQLAESICEDILRAEPDNMQALVTLILALTDHRDRPAVVMKAKEHVAKLAPGYEQHYYTGLIWERLASAWLRQGLPGSAHDTYDAYREAMRFYEMAEAHRPPGNDDAILRWNTCARILNAHPELRPRPAEQYQAVLDD